MLMMPPPNRATAERPVGFGFYYMIGTDPKLKPVVEKFLSPGISSAEIDNVGPSPIIITKAMLERVATPWWDIAHPNPKPHPHPHPHHHPGHYDRTAAASWASVRDLP